MCCLSKMFVCKNKEMFPWTDEYKSYEGVEDTGENQGDHVEQDYVREEQDLVVHRGPVHLPLALRNLSNKNKILKKI